MNILKPHVSLNVSDIDASVAFYEQLFDVTVSKRKPGYAKFDLQAPSLNLSLVQGPRTGINASHFGIQVGGSQDVQAAAQRLARAGLSTRSEEQTTCCYAVQDKVWVQDPDGNAWEVFVVHADADLMACDAATCSPGDEAAGCCGTPSSGGCC